MDIARLKAVLTGDEPPAKVWVVSLVAGVFFACLAIFTLSSPINHFGTIDPLLYQSYIRDYDELIELYGYTYYSSRIAWIFPAHWAQALLGDMPGYFTIRVLLLGSAATAFSMMAARFVRWQFAVYAAALYCLFPLIQRAYTHDYVDGAAISYAVIGMGCIFTARPRAYLQHLAGGAFFALAFNAYPLSAIVPAAMAVPWFMLRKDVADEANIGHIGAALAGFALTFALIAFGLWHAFSAVGKPFEIIPISTISTLSAGGAAAWHTGLGEIFIVKQEVFRAYPLFLLMALAAAYIGLRRRPAEAQAPEVRRTLAVLLALCLSVLVIYFAMHFGLRSGVILYPWSYIFAVPACVLIAVYLLDRIVPSRWAAATAAAGVILLLGAAASQELVRALVAARLAWLPLGLVAALAGLAMLRPRSLALAIPAAAALLVFPLGFYTAPGACGYEPPHSTERLPDTYVACMRQDDAFGAEKDLRAGIFALLADVKSTVPLNDPPGLWYANGTNYADVVGSAFLWQYSRVASLETGDPGMPALNGFSRGKIDGYDYLVLIGQSRQELDAGRRALAAAGYAVRPLLARRAGGRDFGFSYEIVQKAPVRAPAGG